MNTIMFERTVIKTVAYILIFTVTVLNFHSNYRKLRKRQIGISIDLTPSNLVQNCRMYVYPLYDYFYENCGNDCDEFVIKGQ